MKTKENYPRVGVGVIVLNSKKQVLLGERKSNHGFGEWAPPGGHLEFGETPIECAIRELKEETGITLLNPQESLYTNDIYYESNKHYITIFIIGDAKEEPVLCEPEKCAGWQWFFWNDLPTPLFKAFVSFLKKKG